MKARTVFLVAGTFGAGAALAGMMRRRGDEHETAEHKAKQPRWRKMAGLIGAGVALKRVMSRRSEA